MFQGGWNFSILKREATMNSYAEELGRAKFHQTGNSCQSHNMLSRKNREPRHAGRRSTRLKTLRSWCVRCRATDNCPLNRDCGRDFGFCRIS
jgi:hypothetical protein